MNIRALSAILYFLLFTILGTEQVLAQNDPLLTVGGQPVSKDELIYLIGKGRSTDAKSASISREEFQENLDLFINYKLKVKEAEAVGLDQSQEFKLEFESFKENLKAPYLIKNSLEEGELRKAYSRMQEVIRASHILFQFPPNASSEDSIIVLKMALKVRQEIEDGANIQELSEKYSDDPSAKVNKGDLGYFTSLQMVQPFEDVAYNLQPGQISDPVLTNFGYHVIEVKERMPNPGQVRVSHILVRVDPTNPNSEDQAKRKISDIYAEIQKPTTVWEDIVKNYSEDPSTSQKGGLLPYFSVGTMIPEFELAAFSLTEEGEVSPPVKTQYGYHILRLEDKQPLASFDEMEDLIRSRILRDSRSNMIQSQVLAIQKAKYGFKENDSNVARLEASLNQVPKSEFETQIKALNLEDLVIFELNNKSYTAQNLAEHMEIDEVSPKAKGGTFDIWYDRFAGSILAEMEEHDLETNNKEYQMLLKEYRDGILLFSLMNEEVWQKGIQDTVGQQKFFKDHLKNYQWKSRANALIVKILDRDRLTAARNSLQGKVYSEDLVNSFESDYKTNHPLAYQTEHGLLEIPSHPVLSQINPELTYQEIDLNGDLYLVLLGEKIPEGDRKFEESRGMVIRDYQEYLDKQLIEKLQKKYPVKINPKVREETFVALNQ